MKTQIETINGRLCTVIRRPFCAEKVRESLTIGVPVVVAYKNKEGALIGEVLPFNCVLTPYEDKDVITILPALPRKPKAEDAALLYRYMAEGLFPACEMEGGDSDDSVIQGWWHSNKWHCSDCVEHRSPVIAHAVDASGNRVEVAIYDR